LLIFNQEVTMTESKRFSTEEACRIGEALGIDWSQFDVEQFRMGLDVELEHGTVDPATNVTGDDPVLTGKIALAHLNAGTRASPHSLFKEVSDRERERENHRTVERSSGR
jgi:hypothetical protein